jgi:hypothetical protein
MKVTLSLASPPTIQDASPQWLKEFGLELRFCVNRTLNLVLGPDTHAPALARLITSVQNGKQAQAQLTLYSRAGTGALFHVRAQPSRTGAGMELTMSRCDVVSIAEAGPEACDGSVQVLLEAKKPFRVVNVSSAFVAAYGFQPEHIINRTLSMIQGPSTDLDAWKDVLYGALFSGSAQAAHIKTYTCNGTEAEGLTHVRVTPVMGSGDPGHLLLISMGHDSVHLSTQQSADQILSGLDGCVRRVIEELRAKQFHCKSAKTPISERATTATGVHRHSSVLKGVPGTTRGMKAEHLPVHSSETAAKRQSLTHRKIGSFTMKSLLESNAAKRMQHKNIRTDLLIHDIPEASCFSLIVGMIMTLLYFLLAGGVFSWCVARSRRAHPRELRTSVYE